MLTPLRRCEFYSSAMRGITVPPIGSSSCSRCWRRRESIWLTRTSWGIWVREVGKGRVFYTAWGHDQRTWSNAGFLALVENGMRWAAENSPTQLNARAGLKPFESVQAPDKLPNYTPNAQWGTQGDPITTMQKPLDPAVSMKHLVTHQVFE